MDLTFVLALGAALLGAALVVLRVVAPHTATQKDDLVLEILERLKDIVPTPKP